MIPRTASRSGHLVTPVLVAWALATTLLVGACDDAVGPGAETSTVTISPLTDSAFEGDSVRMVAHVFDGTGAEITTAPVTWTVSDTTLARVLNGSLVALLRPGRVGITAHSGAANATSDIEINPLVAEVVELTPDTITIGKTDRVPLTARVLGHGGREIHGRAVTFTSDDEQVAIVPGPVFPASEDASLLIGVGAGETAIRGTVDGVTGTAHVTVVSADTTFSLTLFEGSPLPVLIAADSVVWDGVPEFDEVYAEEGALVLSGLLQKRYQLDVWYAQYHVFEVGDTVARELRLRIRGEIDFGVVTSNADGTLSMLSEFIGPHLEHTATLVPDGYLVHYHVPGETSFLDLTYTGPAAAAAASVGAGIDMITRDRDAPARSAAPFGVASTRNPAGMPSSRGESRSVPPRSAVHAPVSPGSGVGSA